MNKHFYSSLIFLLCMLSGTAFAADTKIGIVDTPKVLKQAPQAEAARKKLENEFAPRDAKIVAMQKSIKKLEDKLAKDSAVMSEAARKKQERNIAAKKRDLKRSREEFTEDFNFRRNEELGKLQKLIYETIVKLAREEKYDMVMSESVLYASDKVDMTPKVLDRLRKLFKSKQSKK